MNPCLFAILYQHFHAVCSSDTFPGMMIFIVCDCVGNVIVFSLLLSVGHPSALTVCLSRWSLRQMLESLAMQCSSKHSIKQSTDELPELLCSTEQLITGSWPEYNGLSCFVKENRLITNVQIDVSILYLYWIQKSIERWDIVRQSSAVLEGWTKMVSCKRYSLSWCLWLLVTTKTTAYDVYHFHPHHIIHWTILWMGKSQLGIEHSHDQLEEHCGEPWRTFVFFQLSYMFQLIS